MFCTHDVKAVVTKLNAESAEEDEEEHDQRPLALSGLHVEALSHQGEICSRELRVTLGTEGLQYMKTQPGNMLTLNSAIKICMTCNVGLFFLDFIQPYSTGLTFFK